MTMMICLLKLAKKRSSGEFAVDDFQTFHFKSIYSNFFFVYRKHFDKFKQILIPTKIKGLRVNHLPQLPLLAELTVLCCFLLENHTKHEPFSNLFSLDWNKIKCNILLLGVNGITVETYKFNRSKETKTCTQTNTKSGNVIVKCATYAQSGF